MAQNSQNHVFCIIVGGGMSGVTMGAHLIKMKVLKPWEFRIMDQNAAYGGVWVANHYPGAACDVPSHGYVMRYFLNPSKFFPFRPEVLSSIAQANFNTDWSKKYAPQAEIQQYYQKIGNYYGLPQSTSFSTKVIEARWNEKTLLWEVLTEDCISKKQSFWTANVVVNAGGQFYKPKKWEIPGMETFEGTEWHTAEWRHDFDLRGKRVAIIGTGPSTGQVAPSIQPLVKELYVYQRSATYVVPRGDGPIPEWKKKLFSWFPPLLWMYHLWWYWSVRFTFTRPKLQKLT
jgi:cation diffusion facilitator CzcD-associated flavoprotein CzcO